MAKRPIRRLVLPAFALAVVAGCVMTPASGGQSAPPLAMGTLTTTPTASPTTASPSAEVSARPDVPSTCELTKPTDPFVPPAGYPAPARPPTSDGEWYGSARLWTLLNRNGEVWIGLPRATAGTLTQKTFWWSADFDVNHEPQPAIRVIGRQLDGPGRFSSPGPGTNAQADFGSAMLTGIDILGPGCWQITATYRQASLSYIVWVG
jgi:hypothetical protein